MLSVCTPPVTVAVDVDVVDDGDVVDDDVVVVVVVVCLCDVFCTVMSPLSET